MKLIHRDKFVEDTIIEHQEHFITIRPVLNAEKAFRSIVDLIIINVFANDLLILISVRLKTDAAMKENLQIGPQFCF